MARLRTDVDEQKLDLGPAPEDESRATWRAFVVGLGIIVLVVGGITAIISLVVLPRRDAEADAQFARAQGTLGTLQTQAALTPKPTATTVPTLAVGVVATAGPATRTVPASTGAPIAASGTAPLATAPSTPAVTATVAPAVATSSVARATAASTSAPTAMSLAGAVVTRQPAATAPPAAMVSADQQRIPLAVQGDVDPALVAELEHAYWLYWQARAQALAMLDVAPIRQVADETEVAGAAKYIEQLRADGHSIVTDVSHQAQLLSANDRQAIIADAAEDHSYYVSSATGQPEEPRPLVQVLKTERRFEKLNGAWKVTGSQPYE